MAPATSLKWKCSSSSTRCQSMSRLGPSMKPSSDTENISTTFRTAAHPTQNNSVDGRRAVPVEHQLVRVPRAHPLAPLDQPNRPPHHLDVRVGGVVVVVGLEDVVGLVD